MSADRTRVLRRREFVGGALATVAGSSIGVAGLRALLREEAPAKARVSGAAYGPLRPADENGIRLPEGFASRVIAKAGDDVQGTGYVWHKWPDGAATFPLEDGGWILVSNSETVFGGAGAVRFAADGRILDAYRILEHTSFNCSGGPTPWGSWLSCEEIPQGRVWECDPRGHKRPVVHPAMGVFKHEAAAVDPVHRHVYLTEDLADGRFYRFTPTRWEDLSDGLLEVATLKPAGEVVWTEIPDPLAKTTPTRQQVRGSSRFRRAEGIWYDDGTVYVATTYDTSIWTYDTGENRMTRVYEGQRTKNAPIMFVDQMTASPAGEVFICEDDATGQIPMAVLDTRGRISRFLCVTGRHHANSELTGVAFSPDGRRMYFASQRAYGDGAVYEVSGRFRGAA